MYFISYLLLRVHFFFDVVDAIASNQMYLSSKSSNAQNRTVEKVKIELERIAFAVWEASSTCTRCRERERRHQECVARIRARQSKSNLN